MGFLRRFIKDVKHQFSKEGLKKNKEYFGHKLPHDLKDTVKSEVKWIKKAGKTVIDAPGKTPGMKRYKAKRRKKIKPVKQNKNTNKINIKKIMEANKGKITY